MKLIKTIKTIGILPDGRKISSHRSYPEGVSFNTFSQITNANKKAFAGSACTTGVWL